MRIIFLLILLLATKVSADVVFGTVYSFDLEPVTAIVTIKNGIEQIMVAKNGSYYFEVEPGNYTIVAKAGDLIAVENVTVRGKVRFDIILLPSFEEEKIPELEIVEEDYSSFVALICFAGLTSLFVLKKIKKEKEVKILDEDLRRALEIIKAEGGRITQKDLRKKLGFSEAKTSLIIADLENRGLVEKVKKGRGNIIFLKSK